jgi:hypothetical protein
MGCMKCISTAVLLALFSIPAANAQVSAVKTVYVLPMAGGLDQYLALRLTSTGVVQVVTDPKKADAILTDGIGARLEENLANLFPPPAKDKDAKDDKLGVEFAHPTMQPLAGSRGVIFLVDRNTRDVLWSTFEKPRNSQPDELNHVAAKIVDRFAKAHKVK